MHSNTMTTLLEAGLGVQVGRASKHLNVHLLAHPVLQLL